MHNALVKRRQYIVIRYFSIEKRKEVGHDHIGRERERRTEEKNRERRQERKRTGEQEIRKASERGGSNHPL